MTEERLEGVAEYSEMRAAWLRKVSAAYPSARLLDGVVYADVPPDECQVEPCVIPGGFTGSDYSPGVKLFVEFEGGRIYRLLPVHLSTILKKLEKHGLLDSFCALARESAR